MNETTREGLQRLIAVEHRLYEQMHQHERLAERWQARAELATRRGEDQLAGEALGRKAEHERHARELRGQYLELGEAVRKAKTSLVSNSRAVRIQAPAVGLDVRPALDIKLDVLAREDRLERDLQELKARLAAS